MAQSIPLALPPKLYFRIGEVAELVGVEPHVLRYWEREFRSIRPTKSAKGQRVYSRRDVENLIRVRELLYHEGFTIAGAKKRLHRANETDEHDIGPAAHDGDAHDGESPPDSLHTDSEHDDAPQSGPAHASTSGTAHGEALAFAQRARGELLAIRGEIEAFLAELEVESA
ncbi:MAG: MerR family transcriptional regulator [Polyangiaceae bacterium]|nr:MerR family transcriptional regulator [Polyangiaceae bacterium]